MPGHNIIAVRASAGGIEAPARLVERLPTEPTEDFDAELPGEPREAGGPG